MRKCSRQHGLLLLGVIAASTIGCSGSGNKGNEDLGGGGGSAQDLAMPLDLAPLEAMTVGASGGTVGLTDGTGISIPAGAVGSDTTITISPAPPADVPAAAAGPAFVFGPEGTTFNVPVTVTLPYDASKLGGSAPVVVTAPAGSTAFQALVTTIVDATHVSAPTSHFSTFVVVPDDSPDMSVGGTGGTGGGGGGGTGGTGGGGGGGTGGTGGGGGGGTGGTGGGGGGGTGGAGGGGGGGTGGTGGGGGGTGGAGGGGGGGTGGTGGGGGGTTSFTQLDVLAGKIGDSTGTSDGTGTNARFDYVQSAFYDGGNLYFADSTNNTVRKMVLSTGAVTTVAGVPTVAGHADGLASAATFSFTADVTLDESGNIYVADSNNFTIRMIDPAGNVSTIAGTPLSNGSADGDGPSVATFTFPTGLAYDGAGHLFVADNCAIREIDTMTYQVTTPIGDANNCGKQDGGPGTATFGGIWSIMLDRNSGTLWVADGSNNTIRKVDVSTWMVTTVAGTGAAGGHDGDGLTAATFNYPQQMTLDAGGNLYVVDTAGHTLRKLAFDTNGVATVSTLAGLAGVIGSDDGTGAATRFNQPGGLTTDGAGNLYIADAGNNEIREFVIATGQTSTIAGKAGNYGTTDGDGSVARFNGPWGAVSDGAGNIYVADTNNGSIRKVVLASGSATVSTITNPGDVLAPFRIAVDAVGNLYVIDRCRLQQIAAMTGAVTTLAGDANNIYDCATLDTSAGMTLLDARFKNPLAIVSDGATKLYIGEAHVIRVVDIAAGTVTTIAGDQSTGGTLDGTGTAARFRQVHGLAYDAATATLYVADANAATIRMLTLGDMYVKTIAGSDVSYGATDGTGAAAQFNHPNGISLDPSGALYIADTGNHEVRKLVIDLGTGMGVVTTVVGTPSVDVVTPGALPGGLDAPYTVVALSDGSVVIADFYENALLRVH